MQIQTNTIKRTKITMLITIIVSTARLCYFPGQCDARNDKSNNIHPLTCAKQQLHLRPVQSSGVITGRRSVAMATGDTKENSPEH